MERDSEKDTELGQKPDTFPKRIYIQAWSHELGQIEESIINYTRALTIILGNRVVEDPFHTKAILDFAAFK